MDRAASLDSLVVRFGDTVAVDSLTMSVATGTIHAVLGPNGAGKTTAMETLLGFRRPTSGSVQLLGVDPMGEHRHVTEHVGALLQRGGVWFPMSPIDALTLTASYYQRPRTPTELLDLLSLNRCATTPWRRLSGGEQQRTLLALAMVGRPEVLVLDEPTSAVDPEGHEVIQQVLLAERTEGRTVLLTTHQLDDAEAIADHVTIVDRGRVILDGPLAELRSTSTVIVEMDRTVDGATLSARVGAPVSVSETTCRVFADDVATVTARLTAALADLGVTVVSLRTRASLREVYLDAVENSRNASRS